MQHLKAPSVVLALVLSGVALAACTDRHAPLEVDWQASVEDEAGTNAVNACVDVGDLGDFYCEPYPCASLGGSWQVDENGNTVCVPNSGDGGTGGGGSGGDGGGGTGGGGDSGGGDEPPPPPPAPPEPIVSEAYFSSADALTGLSEVVEPDDGTVELNVPSNRCPPGLFGRSLVMLTDVNGSAIKHQFVWSGPFYRSKLRFNGNGEFPVGFSQSTDGWWIVTSATLLVACRGTYAPKPSPFSPQRAWRGDANVIDFVDGKASVQSGPNHPHTRGIQ